MKPRVKLELDRREYGTLLSVLEIADWVLHAYKLEEPADTRGFRALEQKVLALAEAAGCGELVDYDAIEGRYFPTREFDQNSSAMDFIEEFESDGFWDQLMERLVERDLMRQLGERAFQALEPEERELKEEPYRRLYGEEFATHGVDRLEILALADASAKGRLS